MNVDQEEQAFAEYQQIRRQLEEEEEELARFRRKGEQFTNETYAEMQWLVQRFGEDNEPLDRARHELSQLEGAFFSELDREKRNLSLKEEDAEQAYRQKIREQNN